MLTLQRPESFLRKTQRPKNSKIFSIGQPEETSPTKESSIEKEEEKEAKITKKWRAKIVTGAANVREGSRRLLQFLKTFFFHFCILFLF